MVEGEGERVREGDGKEGGGRKEKIEKKERRAEGELKVWSERECRNSNATKRYKQCSHASRKQ